jgi:hypothetical protein
MMRVEIMSRGQSEIDGLKFALGTQHLNLGFPACIAESIYECTITCPLVHYGPPLLSSGQSSWLQI